jgi:hypothetical protein
MQHRRFTPHRWNSEDGEWTFYMGESGAIDMLPGPNHRIMQWFKSNGYVPPNSVTKPFDKGNQHIHWAV